MIYKHLPGQHDQKLHGKATGPSQLDLLKYKLRDVFGNSGYVSLATGHAGASCVHVDNGIIQLLVYPPGQYRPSRKVPTVDIQFISTPSSFLDYSEQQKKKLYQSLKLSEKAIRAFGAKAIRISALQLPIVAAANLGYYLTVNPQTTLEHDAFQRIVASVNIFNRNRYDIELPSTTDNDRLADILRRNITGIGLSVESALELHHPNAPELSYLTEYMMTYGKNHTIVSQLSYVKDLL